jgi:hypothetical protein
VKYAVEMARTTWLTAYVEADDDEGAVEAAFGEVPPFTAMESGWGSFGKWSADADEWQTLDEFYGPDYAPSVHGSVVRPAEDREGEAA